MPSVMFSQIHFRLELVNDVYQQSIALRNGIQKFRVSPYTGPERMHYFLVSNEIFFVAVEGNASFCLQRNEFLRQRSECLRLERFP